VLTVVPRILGSTFGRPQGLALLASPFATKTLFTSWPAVPLLGFILSKVCPRQPRACRACRLSCASWVPLPRVSPWVWFTARYRVSLVRSSGFLSLESAFPS